MNPCEQFNYWLGLTGFGALASGVNFAIGNLPFGVLSAIGTLVGFWKMMETYSQCQALRAGR